MTKFVAKKLLQCLAFAFALACSTVSAQTTVKIAIVGPLSGSAAHYGKDNERGARLAIEDLNASNMTIAGKSVKFELISEDDQADPKQAIAVALKLVDSKVNGIVGHNNSGTTIPAAKIYNDAQIVHITPAASNPKLTQLGYNTTFRTIAHDGLMGSALAIYAITDLKIKQAAVIDDRTAYGQGLADEFEKTFKSMGGKIVSRQFTNDKATDFMAILTRVKASKPQVVFYGGLDGQAGPMLRQMKSLGMDDSTYFMGGDGVCTTEISKLGGDSVGKNVVCADGGEALMNMVKGPEFAKRYKEKYSADVVVYAPFAYDNTMLLAQAMKAANSIDPAAYRKALSSIKYSGITGAIQFDGNGQRKNSAVTLSSYPGGNKTPLKTMK